MKLLVNREDIAFDRMDDEVVLLNMKQGLYYSLQGGASQLFAWLEEGSDWEAMATALAADAATREVLDKWLQEMLAERLLVPADEPGTPFTPPAGFVLELPVLQKFSDLQDLLLIDPVHDVDEQGWPVLRAPN